MKEQPNQAQSAPHNGGNGNQHQGGLSERTEEVAGRAREAAIERVEHVRDRAREGIDQGKQQMAVRIRRLGSALHSASDNLREEDGAVARYAEIASETIERAANYVGSADLKTTVRDVENLARRQPALFFGGAFLLGLAAGRFLRSSAGRPEDREGFTSADWPKQPPPPISVPSAETEGLFDADKVAGRSNAPAKPQPLPSWEPAGGPGRRST